MSRNRAKFVLFLKFMAVMFLGSLTDSVVVAEKHPLPLKERKQLEKRLQQKVERYNKLIEKDPERSEYYSQRGDALFFLGEFDRAVNDYNKMVELKPELKTSHWRRGIACFYAEKYKQAARQFEIYHTFDNVDRENGIWRYFSQRKAYGAEKARKGLLKYEKDDREPFPSVYMLFAGKISPKKILQQIESVDISDREREKRLFYAHLYIGLNCDLQNQPKKAKDHLRHAVANEWGASAGYGPRYMWHVGRLHYERLREKDRCSDSSSS